jgi:hypothetical protein
MEGEPSDKEKKLQEISLLVRKARRFVEDIVVTHCLVVMSVVHSIVEVSLSKYKENNKGSPIL